MIKQELNDNMKLIDELVRMGSFVQKDVTGSTNDDVLEAAGFGAKEGYCVVASSQTNGHGRSGRNFYSPTGGNLYLSLLMRPGISVRRSQLITPAAAVAAQLAIKECMALTCKIKWVNDLIYRDRKVGGILVSGEIDDALTADGEPKLKCAVLGIGINIVEAAEIPEDIKGVYGALLDAGESPGSDMTRLLAGAFLKYFDRCYMNIEGRSVFDPLRQVEPLDFMPIYREESCVIGRQARYISGTGYENIFVEDIDEEGSLVAKRDDGTVRTFRDGEIRIKL